MAVVKGLHKIKLVYTHESISGGGMKKGYTALKQFNCIFKSVAVH